MPDSTTKLTQLLALASGSIAPAEVARASVDRLPKAARALAPLLLERNGFYAFDDALHLLALGATDEIDCLAWNLQPWRREYSRAIKDVFFFAEDAFANQYGVENQDIIRLDPETGAIDKLGNGLEAWAAAILDDSRWLTGWPMVHQWVAANGPIPRGMRLTPTIPFVLGGEYAISNLHMAPVSESVGMRADFYRQTKHLRDGDRVKIQVINREEDVPTRTSETDYLKTDDSP